MSRQEETGDERRLEDISCLQTFEQQVPERTALPPLLCFPFVVVVVVVVVSGVRCLIRSPCVSSCRRPPRTTTPPPRPASPPSCRAAGTPSATWRRWAGCLSLCLCVCLCVCLSVCLSVCVCICFSRLFVHILSLLIPACLECWEILFHCDHRVH